MEARNSFCFPKNIKKTEPFSYRKKVRFLQREAPFARFETVQNPCTYSPTNKITLSPTDLTALVCVVTHQKSSPGGAFYLMP